MLTAKMIYAMRIAKLDGGVVAGKSIDRRGSVCTVFASTLRALASRGLVRLSIGPDGGMAATLTADGANSLTLIDSGNGFLVSVGVSHV